MIISIQFLDSELSGNETTDANNLLLPTLDVYVLEENKEDQFISFRPTHPDVKLYLSKKIGNHWIEVKFYDIQI